MQTTPQCEAETRDLSTLFEMIFRAVAEGKREGIAERLEGRPRSWSRLRSLLEYHELASFAYHALRGCESLVPPDLMETLRQSYYHHLLRCTELTREFLRLHGAFRASGCRVLPLKGAMLVHDLYGSVPVRPMVDVDLLVREADLRGAERVMIEAGYRKELHGLSEAYWRNDQYHLTFVRGAEGESFPPVELHWGLDYPRGGAHLLPELWGRLGEMEIEGHRVGVLSPEDTLLSLALHNRRPGKTLCLKGVFDTALLLRKYGDTLDRGYLLEQCRRYGLRATLFFALAQAERIAGTTRAGRVGTGPSVPRWKGTAVRRLLKRHTFSPTLREDNRALFLRSHMLLYDDLRKPIAAIVGIPPEQFAKFFDLPNDAPRTHLLYRLRHPYMAFYALRMLLGVP